MINLFKPIRVPMLRTLLQTVLCLLAVLCIYQLSLDNGVQPVPLATEREALSARPGASYEVTTGDGSVQITLHKGDLYVDASRVEATVVVRFRGCETVLDEGEFLLLCDGESLRIVNHLEEPNRDGWRI
jgi:hypothetical protein